MEINISRLQTEISNYNNKVQKYEDCMQNLYNVFSQSSFCWQDAKSNTFSDNLHLEKRDVTEIINNLNQVGNIYKYVLEKYEKFGKKIKYDLSYASEIKKSFDKLISSLNDLIRRYSALDLSFNPSEKQLILKEKHKIISIKENLEDLKVQVSKIFDEIEEIEKEVNHKISKINIKVIKENDVGDYI